MTDLRELVATALAAVAGARDDAELERLRIEYLGRRGSLSAALEGIARMPKEERPAAGRAANEAKREIEAALAARRDRLGAERLAAIASADAFDVTFPGPPLQRGRIHVLTRMRREIETVLETLGFQVELGPEVETEWFNFEALNISPGHPSRDDWDSFYFSQDLLLRAHTSPVQVRAMRRLRTPPIYVITPGRCYRRDAVDSSHLPYFMQMEGLAVDGDLTVGDLKGTLLYMLQTLYGRDRKVRMRPSHFPFTEPSFEFDLSCGICKGSGCRSCGGDGWLEVGGCGMVHPRVLENGGLDPQRLSGYAWGFGIERMAMLKYDVDDLRLFYENDLRFLEQA